jgi:hypothetical protein
MDTDGWSKYLLKAIEGSDVAAASRLKKEGPQGEHAWNVHLTLFPAVQRVLNPPYINPHLPKMYAVCREFRTYMQEEDIPGLLYMETIEYARRAKLERHLQTYGETKAGTGVTFADVERAIRSRDLDETTLLLAAFLRQKGARKLASRLLLLGSGYMVESLGHSISCTAFILQELMEQRDEDVWPALFLLADYFIKGRFANTPSLRELTQAREKAWLDYVSRSTSGSSFIDIHHTITLYSIERVQRLFSPEEYAHLVSSWLDWMGEKEARPVVFDTAKQSSMPEYAAFYDVYSTFDQEMLLKMAAPLTASAEGRKLLGRFLIRGLCDLYQGDYDPHYVTGLGAVLWIATRYAENPSLVSNAFHQYLAFLFGALSR